MSSFCLICLDVVAFEKPTAIWDIKWRTFHKWLYKTSKQHVRNNNNNNNNKTINTAHIATIEYHILHVIYHINDIQLSDVCHLKP